MPFDGVGFPKRADPPRRDASSDNMVSIFIIAVAFCLLAMPISLQAFVDIVRYLRGNL